MSSAKSATLSALGRPLFALFREFILPAGISATLYYALHGIRLQFERSYLTLYNNLKLDNSKDEIRLLVLTKRSPQSSCQHLRFRLITTFLREKPAYFALSYVWGPPVFSETVLVNGRKVAITPNLHEALEQIQSKLDDDNDSKYWCIWTDAICINQSNDTEKNQQIRKMGAIFQSASSVIAYLGPDRDNCHVVFDDCSGPGMRLFFLGYLAGFDARFASDLYAKARKDRTFLNHLASLELPNIQRSGAYKTLSIIYLDAVLGHEISVRDLKKEVPLLESDPGSESRAAWQSFCRRDFWRRAWIFQELVLGNDVVLQAGSRTTKLEYFLAVFCLSNAIIRMTNPPECKRDTEFQATVYGDARDLIDAVFQSKQEPRDLQSLIWTTQLLQATRNEDKIFALLSLATDREELNIDPTHKKPFEDSCRDCAKSLVLKYGTAALASSTRNPVEYDKVPSWVNMYSVVKHDKSAKPERRPSPLSANRTNGDHKFSASGEVTQEFDDSSFPMPGRLRVKGRPFAEVLEITGTDFDSSQLWTSGDEADFKEGLKMLQKLINFAGQDVVHRESLWWVPILHRNPQDESSEGSPYAKLDNDLLESYEALVRVRDGGMKGDVLNQTAVYRRFARRGVEGQIFFKTSGKSHIGMGSSALQKADQIVIFLGGQMPFAVRPKGNGTYRLLGEVYVLGIMHGEFMAKKLPVQEYILE